MGLFVLTVTALLVLGSQRGGLKPFCEGDGHTSLRNQASALSSGKSYPLPFNGDSYRESTEKKMMREVSDERLVVFIWLLLSLVAGLYGLQSIAQAVPEAHTHGPYCPGC